MPETWLMCGNCVFFCVEPELFLIVRNSGDCQCPRCKHQARFNKRGEIGHMAPSNANAKPGKKE